jgi:uncharacterized membrane protein
VNKGESMLYIGMIVLILGLMFKLFRPRRIDILYGYRTKLAVKNQDTWDVAQKYAANSLIILGFIYVALGFKLNELIGDVSISYQLNICLIGLLIMLIFDEIHLRRVFNRDGSRKK